MVLTLRLCFHALDRKIYAVPLPVSVAFQFVVGPLLVGENPIVVNQIARIDSPVPFDLFESNRTKCVV